LYVVLFSIITLFLQLFVLFACCSGLGLSLRFILPKEFSLLNKVLFSLLGGLFLAVLIPQNLVYLGVPVRISAWPLLAAALVQVWFCRRQLLAFIRTFYARAEIRTLAMIILLTITFHGIVPTQQGLKWYYGKAFPDHIYYVELAEFLKEEPYGMSEQDVGLRPWLAKTATFLKMQRIGQSIITAEISVWSGTDGKGGYPATVIFFLALLAICLYAFLRDIGINCFMAGSGALMAALLPAVTRLSLNGFLSQISILFVFPFFASLLRREDLSARRFVLFFSLTLAYVVACYPEIAPIGFCTLFFGVSFVRRDKFRTKRLMFMSAILLTAIMNPFYLRNLIEFLGQQFSIAINGANMEHLAPNLLTLRGWSELIFGETSGAPLASFFDYCVILLGLSVAGAIFLFRRDRLIFGAVLLPGILAIFYLATRAAPSYYPIAKITLSILPLAVGLVFVALSRVFAHRQIRGVGTPKKLLATLIVTAAAAGSVRYYSEVLNNGGLLRIFREPRFLNVCRELEEIKNKRVFIFENDGLLTPWLCYFARHNDVYVDGRILTESPVPPPFPFSVLPDLKNIDLVVTRERIVDLSAPSVTCLTFIDDGTAEDRTDGRDRYWLGPPADLRFLALKNVSANLTIRLGTGPEITTYPIKYFLADGQGHVVQGEFSGKNVEFRRLNFPLGFSTLELSVKTKKESDLNAETPFPVLAELDGVELSDIDNR
jgi:hypothetical protein